MIFIYKKKLLENDFDTINFLRKKIDKDHENKLIHTYVGMGYILKEK